MANPSERDAALLHNQDGAGPNHIGQLDNAGQAILKLLDQAAGAAEANSRRALETAQTLSSKLHAAEIGSHIWRPSFETTVRRRSMLRRGF